VLAAGIMIMLMTVKSIISFTVIKKGQNLMRNQNIALKS